LTTATLLSRTGVVAVAATVGREHVWERCSIAELVGVNAITNACTVLHRIGEDADDGA
jgi:hypothetical protein